VLEAAESAADPRSEIFHAEVLPLADRHAGKERIRFNALLRSHLKGHSAAWRALPAEEQGLLLRAAWAFTAPPATLMRLNALDRIEPVDLFGEPTPRPWLLPNMIPLPGVGAIVGAPGSGKTFVAADLAARVAAATEQRFLGQPVTQGGVLYFASESVASIGTRVRQWAASYGDCRTNFRLIPHALPLSDSAEALRRVVLAAAALPAEVPLRLIVVDVYRGSINGDENDNAVASAALSTANLLARYMGAAVLIVHHSPRSDPRRPSGGNAFDALTDWMACVERKGGTMTLDEIKHRDSEGGTTGKWHVLDGVLREGAEPVSGVTEYSAEACAAALARSLREMETPVSQKTLDGELAALFPTWFAVTASVSRGTVTGRAHRVRKVALERHWIEKRSKGYHLGPGTPPPEAPADLGDLL
jgi:hypothetical protein